MKSSKVKMCAMALACSLLLSACGEKQITLTDGEEAAIVNYAAHVISKYNTRQPDGLTYVPPTMDQEETPETEQEAEPEVQDAEAPQTTETPSGAETPIAEETPATTLTEALGVDGISAEYTSSELTATYRQEDYYAVDASAGYSFLVVNVKLINSSEGDVALDMLSDRPTFKAKVNGNVTTTAQTTILLNDLSTYQGTIAAGQSLDTVLLFQVPNDQVTVVDSIELTISLGGSSKSVTL